MSRKKKLIISFFVVILFGFFSLSVAAAIIAVFSVRGNVQITSTTLDAEASYTSSTSSFRLTYNSPGDSKYVTVTVNNDTDTDSLHVYHEIDLKENGADALVPAILVYLNDEYVGTLSSIISNNTILSDEYSLVGKGTSISDKISFELHNSADNGLFEGKQFDITIRSYTENMDYEKYILVNNAAEFTNAINDVNSGLFSVTPTIVLANAITVGAVTITNPCKIHTDYALTCPITLNDTDSTSPDALLEISGKGTISTVTLDANYDKEGAKALVKEHVLKKLGNGLVASNSVNIVGPYTFYGLSITTDSTTTFTSPNLTSTVNYTTTSDIAIGTTAADPSKLEFEVKVLGSVGTLAASALNHMPATDEIVSCDLFLPTSIPSQNATITWTSSDTSIMSNDGKIVASGKIDSVDGAITLTAVIKVNGNVYTTKYDFKVSSHSNEVNFQKLVQEMSPLIITLVDDGTEDTKYYLPIVGTYNTTTGKFSQYDYRTTFTTPVTDPTVTWYEYQNINLASLVYSMTTEQSEAFDYITIDSTTNNKIYLSKNTLSNYAKITVTGTFENGEEYSSIVNISIAVGTDTQLLEKAFLSVDSALDEISILGNILKTRSTSGIIGEKGDFILPSKYGTNYTLTYRCDSEIIIGDPIAVDENGDATLDESEITGYKFVVNPLKFNSSETSIPIYVTVTYEREGLDDIVKQKVVYIDAPAAIHKADVGSISIFNSLKYQTFQAIGETTNNGFSTNGPILTDSGYDYLLIRDIIGDESYLTDYRVDDLYLTMNNITSANYATGVVNVKLYVSDTNNTSTTDTDAYDFIKLIQWAMGTSKVSASTVVSAAGQTTLGATLGAYKSNGEVYLSPNELKVIETFYKAKTNDDGTLWDALKSISMETAPGRIYDNADLLEAVLRSLTNEKGTNSTWYENNVNGTYGKIYAKYLEIVNRYAITTSENEEPMSPAQEVYNSKFYYSFTPTAQNNTTGTTAVSFPCRYYNAQGELVSGYCNRYGENNWRSGGSGTRQGTYAASNKTGNAAVDLYANETGYPYDSDKTKYITSAELMVIKAFWLGSLGTKTADAETNVLHEFSDASKTLISAALAAKDGILPYPDYTIDDFTYYGQAILNAFDACLVIPTYLSSNGVNLLISSFYDNYNTDGYKYKSYTDSTDTTTFKSVLVNSVPAVTNLDNLEGGLSFFSNLTTLDIKGNTSLAAFLGDYGLSQAFARITLTNTKLTSLTMQYVSSEWNVFDLTNIKNLVSVSTVDVSNNLGIKSVTPFLNSNRGSYTSVNFSNIGEVYEYNSFVIDNLAYSCNVTYSSQDQSVLTKNKIPGNASSLISLSDINDLVSEHLYLTNVIYNEDGSETDVCWRIEQGNGINGEEINQGGELEKITSVNEMNLRISPYYYCESSCVYEGYTFTPKHVYKITINDGVLSATDLTPAGVTIDIVDSSHGVESTTLTPTTGDPVTINRSDEFDRTSTAVPGSTNLIYSQTTGLSEQDKTYNIYMYYQVFSFEAYNEMTYEGNIAGTHRYYLRSNISELKATSEAIDSSCYMVLLSKKEAQFIDFLYNNAYEISSAQMSLYGIYPDNYDNVYLGIQNLNANVDECYIYNAASGWFMFSGGFNYTLGDTFSVVKNGSYWNIKDTTTDEYLDSFKQLIYDSQVGSNVISAVFNTTSRTSDNMTTTNNAHKKCYNSNWTLTTNNASAQEQDVYTASLNTPTITVTTEEGKKYTATFNCYTIRNARQTNNYNNPNTGTDGSRGYVYDNGATLLLSINNTQPADYSYYFCLLTDEDITRLNSWYANPNSDISFGQSVSRANNSTYDYFIYNPFTKRYATGTYTNDNGSAFYTTSVKPSYPFKLTYGSSTNGGTGVGYSICLYGGYGYVQVASGVVNNSNYMYYYTKNGNVYSQATRYSNRTTYYEYRMLLSEKSWNAYGGISDSCYGIATWSIDSGSLWVFDDVQTENQYTYTYQAPAYTTSKIAYSLSYTINLVTAHIVRNDISRYYEFDKYYYLDEDTIIDGNIYKKGGIIRFAYNAYYGKSYQANILYYEVVFTYTKHDGTSDTVINPANLDTLYYIEDGIGCTGTIEYFKAIDTFDDYNQGFNITQDVWNEKYNGTITSSDSVTTGNLTTDGYLYLSTANAVKATITIDGFTTGEYLSVQFIDGTGSQIGSTQIGKALNNLVSRFTFNDANQLVFESNTPFTHIKFMCNTSGKNIGITNINVTVETSTSKVYAYDYVYGRSSNAHTDIVTYDTIHWIYTEDSFNEVSYKLYEDDFGLTKATTYVDGNRYYTPTYKEATIFEDTFNARKQAGTLYADENGTPLSPSATYTKGGNYYEIGYNEITSTQLSNTNNETYNNPNSIYNGYTASISLFDYYKIGIYSDSNGTRVSLNATYSPGTTYYFKTTENGNVIYLPYGPGNNQYRPSVYDSVVGDYIPLSLDATTFEYFKHSLFINKTRIDEDAIHSSNNSYYIDTFVKSNFEQELFDAYNSVLYLNMDGQAVGIDATFNPLRTYYTNEFEVASSIDASNFETYKSVLYGDAYGTSLAVDVTYNPNATYYKKHLIESSPEPSGNVEDEWVEEIEVTRLYSHSKKVATDDKEALDTYKDDYANIAYSKYPTLYQFIGTNGSEPENIYSNPDILEVYTPVLTGLISESNWDDYQGKVYTKTGSNYTICNSEWNATLETVIFYKKTYKTVSNVTTRNQTYEVGAGYTLSKSAINIFGIDDSNVLIWNYNSSGANNTAATMDEILTTANSHYHDTLYNQYYGMHYAYNGFTMGSGLVTLENIHVVKDLDGQYTNGYERGYVYRIVINPEKTGFMWEKVYAYSRKEGAQMVTDASTGVAQVGDTIWAVSQCFGGFYTANKFYRIVDDEFTKTLNVIQFTDITINNTDSGYTDIQSQKIRYIKDGNYLGYAGTFEIIISAVERIDAGGGTYNYTDAVRTYKIKLTGTVIM